MPQRVPDRIRPITPQLAWRVAVLGGMAFVLFAIVFFRLWFLQVLSGQDYVSQARQNRVRKVRIEAPRGNIVDTNGVTLVGSKLAAVVQIVPTSLPASVTALADDYRKRLAAAQTTLNQATDRYDAYSRQLRDDGVKSTRAQIKELHALKAATARAPRVAVPQLPASEPALAKVYSRLSRALLRSVSAREIFARVIRGIADQPYSNVTVETDVPSAEFDYISERAELFPGIVVTTKYLRSYPSNDLAAQLFGTVSEITAAQRQTKKYAGIAQGTRIGQTGLEARYDSYLRGKDGYTRVIVNASGTRDDQAKARVQNPTEGQSLKLTLDEKLQKAGDAALARGIAASAHQATAGAYVAMDPTNGAILAMGSRPGFNANIFAKPFTKKTWDFLTSDSTSAPLLDRAYESGYPTGSIFKPVTALAAMDAGLLTPSQTFDDTGTFKYGDKTYHNAKSQSFGPINLSEALKVSSDLFFFHLGSVANPRGPIIQKWAKRLGFGRRTGLDVPGETPGLVPDANWRNAAYVKYRACAAKAHVAIGSTPALFACGGVERGWSGGDDVNLAVGQGDLQATPLQVAVAYSALENNGRIVNPHLAKAIEDGQLRTIQELHFPARRNVKLDPVARSTILDGLHRATSQTGGTSSDVFKGWDQSRYPLYGKTGTAERGLNPDQAWYACFVKVNDKPIVVVVTIERGGFGAETAAPTARLILSQWFDVPDHQFHAGSSTTL